jgi:hypothetical protein
VLADSLQQATRWLPWQSPHLGLATQLATLYFVYKHTLLRGQPLPGLEAEGLALAARGSLAPLGRLAGMLLLLVEAARALLRVFPRWRALDSLLGLANLLLFVRRGDAASWVHRLLGVRLVQQKGTARSFDLSIIQVEVVYEAIEGLIEVGLPFLADVFRSKLIKNLFFMNTFLSSFGMDQNEERCEICSNALMAMPQILPCEHVFCYFCLYERTDPAKPACPCCKKYFDYK